MSHDYKPETVPFEYSPEFFARELERISQALALVHNLDNATLPARPRLGMVRYFDGARGDPGAGEGLYVYKSTGWAKAV